MKFFIFTFLMSSGLAVVATPTPTPTLLKKSPLEKTSKRDLDGSRTPLLNLNGKMIRKRFEECRMPYAVLRDSDEKTFYELVELMERDI